MQTALKILLFTAVLQLVTPSYSQVFQKALPVKSTENSKTNFPVFINDNFEHGTLLNWGNISHWENSEEAPISGNYSLKHSIGTTSSYIYHPLEIPDLNSDTITWRLQFKNGDWDPSSSNKFWFYLTSDRINLSSGVNGYAVGVNFTGSDDLLKVWRITGGVVSATVISSTLDWNANTLAGIEVTRFPGGRWELKINRGGGFVNLISSGTGIDNTHITSQACGLMFIYTTGRIGWLWMDDVYAGPPIPDTIPPHITQANVITPKTITLSFSELVSPITALENTNYIVDNSINPILVEFLPGNQQAVTLHFEEPFSDKIPFVLAISGIKDLADNLITPVELSLQYESLKVNNLRIINDKRLKLTFNKEVSALSAATKENYTLFPGSVHPITASLSTTLKTEVFLDFASPFTEKEIYTLRVENIRDNFNDIILPVELEFVYYKPAPYDVVINEIMARPSPSNGLPEFEYLELYNTSDYRIDLTGWFIRVGTTTRSIPESQIQPGGFLILCHQNNVQPFKNYGKTIGISSFPAISDAGQTISLLNNQEQVISSVAYTDKWYGSTFKASGGWSLEQKDPSNPCAGRSNWSASMNPSGGTPGTTNSIFSHNPDLQKPSVSRAVPISSTMLRVFFSESYHYLSVSSPNLFSVDNQVGHPAQVILNPPLFRWVDLIFSSPFLPGLTYTVNVEQFITDCAGNILGARNSVRFELPSQPENFDLVVNEILFNPMEEGVDFVEVYNRSNKVINLQDVLIASRELSSGVLKSIYQASNEGFLIFPSDFAVITTRSDLVLRDYYSPNIYGFSEIPQLPAFNNDKGNVVLLNKSLEVLDEFSYDEKMHYPLLTGAKGVSLERINYNKETNDPLNWHSASQTVGFATPAYQNSQFKDVIDLSEREIVIDPDIFSPDNDGVDDLVNIYYEFEKPGFVVNITIFDSRGKIIRKLVRNQFLGTSGFFSWDGTNDARQMSPLGIYLIFIDLFHSDGTVKQIKKTCVLAGKLY